MARRFFQIALGAALILLGLLIAPCRAQAPAAQAVATPAASPSPGDDTKGEKHSRPFRKEFLTPEQQKKYDGLPPDQQAKMRENWERWQNMTPDERKEMENADKVRRQKMLQEIDEAIVESGLQLDDKTRDEYIKRYTQERRKIEQKLQKEMEENRRPLVQALIERLKTEFQAKSSPAAASPSPSPQTSGSGSS